MAAVYKEFRIGGGQPGRGGSPFGMLGPLLLLGAFMVLAYFVFKGIFTILSFVAPVLLIATAFIDFSVITDYIKFMLKLLKENPIMGVVGIVLTVMAFPFVAGFLFFRAMMRRTIKRASEKQEQASEESYSDYEEIEDNLDIEDVESLELPEIEIEKPQSNDYDNLFK